MATYTITDILGSDNIASSRAEIAANFKILTDGLNKVETFLNTSPNGADLNISNVLVKKYNKSVNDTIFSCEASGSIIGKLIVGGDFTAANVTAVTNVTTKTLTSDAIKTSTINAYPAASIENILSFKQSTNVYSTGTGYIPDTSVILVDWTNITTANISVANAVDGQLLVVRSTGTVVQSTTLGISSGNSSSPFFTFSAPATLANVKIILQYNAAIAAWELISILGATPTFA